MPTLPSDEFRKCLMELVKMEKDWIPEGRGYSMYIRPTMIATTAALGVGPPK
jgi:branched-chain amino acid aminotransferase